MGNKASGKSEPPVAPDNVDDDDEGAFQDSEGAPARRPSYYQMAKSAYESLVRAIIRPPRCNYEARHLGPLQFDFCGKMYERSDFSLINPRGLKLMCSHWQPVAQYRPHTVLPCVVYMHGNSSARLEAIPQLAPVLSLGATLLSFDFCGSGKSEGEWVSLGAFEKDDLQVVVEHLRSTGTTSTIALWGRSMGAATSLLHGERDPSIAGMVLDSSFSDLNRLAEEMVERGRKQGLFAPGFVVAMAIRWIRGSVKKQANFDINDLSPIRHADRCFIPALFVAAEGDEFVPKHHSEEIHKVYAGDKSIIAVDGDHNSIRPQFAYDSITNFLQTVLYIPPDWILEDGFKLSGMPPWSFSARREMEDPTVASNNARPARKHYNVPPAPPSSGSSATARIERSERGRALSRDATGNYSSAAVPALPKPSESEVPGRRKLDDALARSQQQQQQQMAVGMNRDMQRGVESTVFNFFSVGGQQQHQEGGNSREQRQPVTEPPGEVVEPDDDKFDVWECGTCTLINGGADLFCLACDAPRELG